MSAFICRLSPGAAIAVFAAVLVGVLALLPGTAPLAHGQTAGAPPAPPAAPAPVVESVSPAAPETIAVPGADLLVIIPAGSNEEPYVIVITPIAVQDPAEAAAVLSALGIPPPAGTGGAPAVVATLFEIEATENDGDPVGLLDAPATISLDITPEILALAGGNTARLSLQFFDEATQSWQPVPCVVVGATLQCQVPHFSLWALVVTASPIVLAPTTPGAPGVPSPADTGTGTPADASRLPLLAAALGAVALAAAGGLVAGRVRARR